MGLRIEWYVEKQVMYVKFFEVITERELIQAIQQTTEYLTVGSPPVHNIIDTLEVTEFPINLRWVLHVMRHNKIPLLGWNIIVQNNRTIQFLATTILGVLHVQVHVCDSLEDAEAFLRSVEPSLPAHTAEV